MTDKRRSAPEKQPEPGDPVAAEEAEVVVGDIEAGIAEADAGQGMNTAGLRRRFGCAPTS